MTNFVQLFIPILIISTSLLTSAVALAQDTALPLINPGFDKDLSGWQVEGNAVVDTSNPLAGAGSLRLGPGKAAVRQRFTLGGLTISGFTATLKADPPGIAGLVRFQCFDSRNHLLLDITQGTDPKKNDPKGDAVGIYLKTQAHTAYVVVSIEKPDASPGYIYADSAELDDYDRGRTTHAPTCNLDQYMQPIWAGKTVYNETILLTSIGGKPASGNLLFTPTHILSVQDYSLATNYAEGNDYTLDGKTITCSAGSTMPFVKDTDFPAGDFPWYVIDGKHIVVTYTHDDTWSGPTPAYSGADLPNTINLLRHRKPLTVVACGDSITLGLDTSEYMEIPPYMPTWAELFTGRLKHDYDDGHIALYNTALGGMTSEWGLDNADSTVAALNPDLVLIAFGMNDFWSIAPDEFHSNIQGIMARVRARRPRAEFILISSMPFDPAYTSDPIYTGHMTGYVTALKSLTGKGVQLLDMNAIGAALYAQKKPKDLIGNPLHPNDFLARWYAQGLAAMLTPPG
jgi:lysophospholipase L1-like esterase